MIITVVIRARIDLHELTAQIESTTDQRMVNTFCRSPKVMVVILLSEQRPACGYSKYTDAAPRYLHDRDIAEGLQRLCRLC